MPRLGGLQGENAEYGMGRQASAANRAGRDSMLAHFLFIKSHTIGSASRIQR